MFDASTLISRFINIVHSISTLIIQKKIRENLIIIEANFEMPCKVCVIGTNEPGLFKAKAENLVQNLG